MITDLRLAISNRFYDELLGKSDNRCWKNISTTTQISIQEIDIGYDTQQGIADEVGIGRSTVLKYMSQFRDASVPLIESSGHNS